MFTLTLVTPEKKILAEAPITEVFVPAFKGELNILPGHAPLMTTLQTGILRYRAANSTELTPVAISWGYCQVFAGGVNVLAETAEQVTEVDLKRALAARKHAEEQVKMIDLSSEERERYYRKIERSKIREELAKAKK